MRDMHASLRTLQKARFIKSLQFSYFLFSKRIVGKNIVIKFMKGQCFF